MVSGSPDQFAVLRRAFHYQAMFKVVNCILCVVNHKNAVNCAGLGLGDAKGVILFRPRFPYG